MAFTNFLDSKSDVFTKPEEGFEKLYNLCSATCTQDELDNIKKAYELSYEAHKEQFRLSGEPYIVHPLSVALIVARLGMDGSSVTAALLHDTVEDTIITTERIKSDFGDTVSELVDGLTKIKTMPTKNEDRSNDPIFADPTRVKQQQQAENIRKMLLAMSKDIRVIIIKLADRLHNMRTLMFKPEQRRRDIALETIEIYAPIAHRLGIRPVKEELEDLSISYLDPVAYKEIGDTLEKQNDARREFLESVRLNILERAKEVDPDAAVSGRIKSIHGIYRKMYMQNKNLDEIYDIYAFRIIVGTVTDCYNCLGIIHDMYKPIPGRFKDYISNPKANMYQSLHTTVLGKEGIPFEVQIRTREMHYTAEYGIAAHWKYKLGMGSKSDVEEARLSWIRQLLETQKESEDVTDIVSTIKSDLVPEEVFAFTPKGDVFSLPSGATVIDFAYAIHSAVGNKMVGAKVDGRIVPIDHQVQTGEIIDIITSSQQGKGPSKDWLKIVKTSQARTKIRQWFKKERKEENIAEGKAEIEKEFKRNFIRLTDDEYTPFVTEMAIRQHCKDLDDFYAAIGYGGISVTKLIPKAKEDYQKLVKSRDADSQPIIIKQSVKKNKKSNDGVVIEGIDNCLIKFSRCCSPLPGDEIIGFITRGHGVSIHQRSCSNVPKDIENCNEPDRWIPAYWENSSRDEFKCTLHLYCMNKIGLLAGVTVMLANMHINIIDISSHNYKDEKCSIYVTLSIKGIDQLNMIVPKLKTIDGVISIERSGI